jgi:hypothetical protein
MIHQTSTPLNAPFHKATVFLFSFEFFPAVFLPEDQRNDQRIFLFIFDFSQFFRKRLD